MLTERFPKKKHNFFSVRSILSDEIESEKICLIATFYFYFFTWKHFCLLLDFQFHFLFLEIWSAFEHPNLRYGS